MRHLLLVAIALLFCPLADSADPHQRLLTGSRAAHARCATVDEKDIGRMWKIFRRYDKEVSRAVVRGSAVAGVGVSSPF